MAKIAERKRELIRLREENEELRGEVRRLKTRVNSLIKKTDSE